MVITNGQMETHIKVILMTERKMGKVFGRKMIINTKEIIKTILNTGKVNTNGAKIVISKVIMKMMSNKALDK